MLNVYTVTFAGHRRVENHNRVFHQLKSVFLDILNQHEFVEFLVGRDGEFDQLAASCIKQLQKEGYREKTALVLVLPYWKKDILYFERYYDEIEICEQSEQAHFKASISIRNQHMVDRCRQVIAYVKQEGGAQSMVVYANRIGRTICNLAQKGI